MLTTDGFDVFHDDVVWDVSNPFEAVVIHNIMYDDESSTAIVLVQPVYDNGNEPYPRSPNELFKERKQCLLAARTKEYDKWRMFDDFIDVTKSKIDRINKELDSI